MITLNCFCTYCKNKSHTRRWGAIRRLKCPICGAFNMMIPVGEAEERGLVEGRVLEAVRV